MVPYASRTGTRRNLDALRAAGWRLLVSAKGVWRTEGFPYAIDNGAWTAFQQGTAFDEDAFRGVVDALGDGADWIVVPDIVAGGLASLDFSLRWLDQLSGVRLLAVQDGMGAEHVRGLLGPTVGIFVGGSTEWKLATVRAWGALAREVGCYCHVGRVNTKRRIALCAEAGVDSFDGTSATRFAVNIPKLTNAVNQSTFWEVWNA
jgi:hypothetical protein